MRIFLFGAGYSARAFSRLMTGEAERIDGTTRNEQNFPTLEKAGIAPIIFDGETASPELIDRLAKSTHVVISISPRESGDPWHLARRADRDAAGAAGKAAPAGPLPQ